MVKKNKHYLIQVKLSVGIEHEITAHLCYMG